MITVGANGSFTPLMIIIKHSVILHSRADQSAVRGIRDSHNKPEFGIEDGWNLIKWEKTMQIADKMEDHKCF